MPSVRARVDACPGALTTHRADDGELARVRVPGGQLTAAQLTVLAACADEFGDGALHLTSRGNVQLRGLEETSALARRLAEAGLLPSLTHERVRNIVASPLSGLVDGLADVRPLVRELDAALCAAPELADLPGRFLFGLDDGRGDIGAPEDDRIDVCWRAVDRGSGELLLAGTDTGVAVAAVDAAAAVVAAATAFAAVRGSAWQVRELEPAGVRAVAETVAGAVRGAGDRASGGAQGGLGHQIGTQGHPGPPLPGVLTQADGRCAVIAGLRFGVLTAAQARLLGCRATAAVLTPWRSVLLPDLRADAAAEVAQTLADAGLVLDPRAPELRITACTGLPGCRKARADVRADATQAMSALAGLDAAQIGQAHFSGCERRCGRPRSGAADVLATGDGYLVDGTVVPAEQLAAALARACEGEA